MLCACRCLSAWIVSKWGWLSLTATGDGFNTRARHQASSGEEQSRISAESGEMLTTAALLLSENSALSTALMCHMMLQSEKYHCPSSNRRADCMCSMVSPSVWVLCNNTRVFWLFFFNPLSRMSITSFLGVTYRLLVMWLVRWRIIYNVLLTNQPYYMLNVWLCSCTAVSPRQNYGDTAQPICTNGVNSSCSNGLLD